MRSSGRNCRIRRNALPERRGDNRLGYWVKRIAPLVPAYKKMLHSVARRGDIDLVARFAMSPLQG